MMRTASFSGNGLTLSGNSNGVYTPSGALSAIPFIHLSSGSVSAVGAITAITALPFAYPNAYCYFPANALATVLAAGWYYCTFSTTTAGTAFLNNYTSGAPTIPGAPTAVTDGKGAFTGDTTERAGPTVTIPANSLGINGQMRIETLWNFNNTAGAKTIKVYYSTSGGTAFGSNAFTTQLRATAFTKITNRGVTNVQIGNTEVFMDSGAVTFTAPAASATDTTASTSVALALTKAVATDNLVLERYSIEILYSS